jgi:ParB family transcriptional regulator, chromosome partitioning protein
MTPTHFLHRESLVEMRKLSDLKATNPYLRMGTDVTELEKSIETLGLIAPLVISTDNVILAGARRYQALLNLGHSEAPVMIVDKNELERELVSIDENLVRKDLSKIEIEAHLRRAKEIYQALHPETENNGERKDNSIEEELVTKKTVLPAEKFLKMVSEKTGLSPKQIHEAIHRDEMASPMVKEARRNGELSLSQTNEIVKLKKEEQEVAIEHIKDLPVRDIKKFVKMAKTKGVEDAITATPAIPFQKEYQEIDSALKKLIKKFQQLKLEGIEFMDLPEETQRLYKDFTQSMENNYYDKKNDARYDSLQ